MHGPWLDNSVFENDPDGSKELEALKRLSPKQQMRRCPFHEYL